MTKYPIPTVARTDRKYDPNRMWRGPTWVNINHLFIEGLARCGYSTQARVLRDKTLELLMRHNDLYEYYHPETGDPPPNAASVYGWSSRCLWTWRSRHRAERLFERVQRAKNL